MTNQSEDIEITEEEELPSKVRYALNLIRERVPDASNLIIRKHIYRTSGYGGERVHISYLMSYRDYPVFGSSHCFVFGKAGGLLSYYRDGEETSEPYWFNIPARLSEYQEPDEDVEVVFEKSDKGKWKFSYRIEGALIRELNHVTGVDEGDVEHVIFVDYEPNFNPDMDMGIVIELHGEQLATLGIEGGWYIQIGHGDSDDEWECRPRFDERFSWGDYRDKSEDEISEIYREHRDRKNQLERALRFKFNVKKLSGHIVITEFLRKILEYARGL